MVLVNTILISMRDRFMTTTFTAGFFIFMEFAGHRLKFLSAFGRVFLAHRNNAFVPMGRLCFRMFVMKFAVMHEVIMIKRMIYNDVCAIFAMLMLVPMSYFMKFMRAFIVVCHFLFLSLFNRQRGTCAFFRFIERIIGGRRHGVNRVSRYRAMWKIRKTYAAFCAGAGDSSLRREIFCAERSASEGSITGVAFASAFLKTKPMAPPPAVDA